MMGYFLHMLAIAASIAVGVVLYHTDRVVDGEDDREHAGGCFYAWLVFIPLVLIILGPWWFEALVNRLTGGIP